MNDKRILVTGHSGFKGSWMTKILQLSGYEVVGLSDDVLKYQLWNDLDLNIEEYVCDINDKEHLTNIIKKINPSSVIHLAAQPLVSKSFIDPITTLQTNILGTANLLESLRHTDVSSIVLATTDKVYDNINSGVSFSETDQLGGHDIYSSSKACMELVSKSYYLNFFADRNTSIATVRSGNVIGGGDFSANRIIPDIVRSQVNGQKLSVRSPGATRPWLHVIEPLLGYLKVLDKGHIGGNFSSWNFGPKLDQGMTVLQLIQECQKYLNFSFELNDDKKFIESELLQLNSQKAKNFLDWEQKFNFEETISYTANWYSEYLLGRPANNLCEDQINDFISR